MRRLIALFLSAAMAFFTVTPLVAAKNQTGTLTGNAKDAEGRNLSNYTVRVRDVATGQLAGSTTSGATGQFSFTGLTPGIYVVEVVNHAGEIIGTSSAVSVAAGATVAVTVGATAAAAAAAAANGGKAFLASTAGIITVAAVGAGVVGVVVATNKDNASPSR